MSTPFKQGQVVRVTADSGDVTLLRYFRNTRRFRPFFPAYRAVGFILAGGIDPQGFVLVRFPMEGDIWIHKYAMEVVHVAS